MPDGYFSINELKEIQVAEGNVLAKVIYHHWENFPADYAFLSWLELVFETGENIVWGVDEDLSGLVVTPFDLEAEKQELQNLGGQVAIRSEDMSQSALWVSFVGQGLTTIGLIKEAENWYRSDQVLLSFGSGNLILTKADEDGLELHQYEEDER